MAHTSCTLPYRIKPVSGVLNACANSSTPLRWMALQTSSWIVWLSWGRLAMLLVVS